MHPQVMKACRLMKIMSKHLQFCNSMRYARKKCSSCLLGLILLSTPFLLSCVASKQEVLKQWMLSSGYSKQDIDRAIEDGSFAGFSNVTFNSHTIKQLAKDLRWRLWRSKLGPQLQNWAMSVLATNTSNGGMIGGAALPSFIGSIHKEYPGMPWAEISGDRQVALIYGGGDGHWGIIVSRPGYKPASPSLELFRCSSGVYTFAETQ